MKKLVLKAGILLAGLGVFVVPVMAHANPTVAQIRQQLRAENQPSERKLIEALTTLDKDQLEQMHDQLVAEDQQSKKDLLDSLGHQDEAAALVVQRENVAQEISQEKDPCDGIANLGQYLDCKSGYPRRESGWSEWASSRDDQEETNRNIMGVR